MKHAWSSLPVQSVHTKCELIRAVKADDCIIARSALPAATLPLHQHGVSPFLQSEDQDDGKNLPRQAEQTSASVIVNVCRITLLEKRPYESLFQSSESCTTPLWHTLELRACSIFRPSLPSYLISWGYPTHPGSFVILKGIDSSFNFRDGGNLIQWLFWIDMLWLSLQPRAHKRLHWPVTVQQLLKLLLSNLPSPSS